MVQEVIERVVKKGVMKLKIKFVRINSLKEKLKFCVQVDMLRFCIKESLGGNLFDIEED